MAKIRIYLKDTPDEIEEPYTYREAKDLIWNLEIAEKISEREQMAEEREKEYIMDIGLWAEGYRGLTWNRVQKVAQALDESQPGWRKERNEHYILLSKVAELNPQLAERWGRAGLKF